MQPVIIFLVFVVIRLSSVFMVKTWFVPDEYWQSLEVAHRLSYGYGYLTWEWVKGIRCYVYPYIVAIIYKILGSLNLDQTEVLVLAPRILQALLSSLADYRLYVWSNRKKWTIFLLVVQWFWFYTASRTLANTTEAILTTIALSYFPWTGERSSFLWWVALCCFIRPTASITWLPLCIYHCKKSKYPLWEMLLKNYFFIGSVVFGIGVAIDSYAHGSLIFTPFEFFKYNWYHNIGKFYGTHPWNWYFVVGLPTILGILTVPFIFAIVETVRSSYRFEQRMWLLVSIISTLIVLSFLAHKEHRFILPLLPMCIYICSDYLSKWSKKSSTFTLWLVAILILFANALPAWYLSQVHQRGALEVMPKLASIAREYKDERNQRANIIFLMPCHSTPYYSHIHVNITMRFLTCDPDFGGQDEFYTDEADDFHMNAASWLQLHIPRYPKTELPTHLVFYDSMIPKISDFLMDYKEMFRTFHTEYPTAKIGKNIVIYERRNSSSQR